MGSNPSLSAPNKTALLLKKSVVMRFFYVFVFYYFKTNYSILKQISMFFNDYSKQNSQKKFAFLLTLEKFCKKVIDLIVNRLFCIFESELINFIHSLNIVPTATLHCILLRNVQVSHDRSVYMSEVMQSDMR